MSSNHQYLRPKRTLTLVRRLLELGFPPRWFRWVHHDKNGNGSLAGHVKYCCGLKTSFKPGPNEVTARRLDLLVSEAALVADELEADCRLKPPKSAKCPDKLKEFADRLEVQDGYIVRELPVVEWTRLIEFVREEMPPAAGWPSTSDLHGDSEEEARSRGPARGGGSKEARPGVYVVTPKTSKKHPVDISPSRIRVVAQVTRDNCKFGRSVDLDGREKSYRRTFRDASPGGVDFEILAELHIDDIKTVESAVLDRLRADEKLMVNEKTDRELEWLHRIDAAGVRDLAERVISALRRRGEIKE